MRQSHNPSSVHLTTSDSSVGQPFVVMFLNARISRCQGCRGKIDQGQPSPGDLVLQHKEHVSNTEQGAPALDIAATQSLQGVDDQAVAQSSCDNQGSGNQDIEAVPSLADDSWVSLMTEDNSERDFDVNEQSEVSDSEDEYLPPSNTDEPMHQTLDLTTLPESQPKEHLNTDPEDLQAVLTAIGDCIEKRAIP